MDADFREDFTMVINKMTEAGEEYAEARGQSYQMQELKGSVLAKIMHKISDGKKISQSALEASAKATQEYEDYIHGVAEAIKREHRTKAELEKYKASFEALRSLSSLEKATRAIIN